MRTRLLIFIASLSGALAFGQTDDPPGRAARLGYMSGTVSFQPGSVEDWVPATLNRPLSTGDRLWTDAGARAELHLGSAALRLNGRTSFAFLNLNDQIAQVQISLGTLDVRLRHLDDQESFEIDTPQAAFSLLRPGDYRVDVNEQGDTTIVAVRDGEGELTAGGQASPVHARQQVRIMATDNGGPPTFDSRDIPPGDAFDNFCQDRDRREDLSESGRHVSRDMPGYADLDGNGSWRQVPDYGWVWAPRVDPGWAPYHTGHWAWIAPWGWTWVDDAPWGYAPFHYGRWAFAGGGWIWVPGPVAVRPVYAPALVAWVGGPSFGVGIAVGGVAAVGWFPLGPGELWVPAYRASPRYFNQVNVSNTVVNRTVNITNVYNNVYVNRNTTNITNVNYVNQNVNGAVTAVPQNAMISGRPVSQAAVRIPPNAVQSAQVQQAAPVAPERAAVLGGRSATPAAPPAAVMNRAVVARATPPPQPVPFAQQQAALRANPGRPLNNAALSQIQSSQPSPQRTLIRPAGVSPRPSTPTNAQQGGGQFNGQAGGQPPIQRGNYPGQPSVAPNAAVPPNRSNASPQVTPAPTNRPQQAEPRSVPPQVSPAPPNRPQQVEQRNVPPQASRPQSAEQPAARPAPKQQPQRREEKGEEKRGEKREDH